VTSSVRVAKAKVAGSNPVFRSKLPGFRGVGGSGLFHERRLFEATPPVHDERVLHLELPSISRSYAFLEIRRSPAGPELGTPVEHLQAGFRG